MIRNNTRLNETAIIQAFGQTWRFSDQVLESLWLAGVDSAPDLKALIIDLTSQKGLEVGQHQVDYSGVKLQISARPNDVTVRDDLSAQARLFG